VSLFNLKIYELNTEQSMIGITTFRFTPGESRQATIRMQSIFYCVHCCTIFLLSQSPVHRGASKKEIG